MRIGMKRDRCGRRGGGLRRLSPGCMGHEGRNSQGGDCDMSTGAIFARGSCRPLRWMVLAVLMVAIGAGEVAAQTPVAPNPPRNVQPVARNMMVVLSWDAPLGGETVTGYQVRHAVGIAAFGGWDTALPALTREIRSLTNGADHRFQVRSVGVGATPLTSIGSTPVTAKPLAPPGAPTGLEATVGDKTVTLKWKAPVLSAGVSYEYRYFVTSAGQSTAGDWIPVTGLMATVMGLTNGTPYTCPRSVEERGNGRCIYLVRSTLPRRPRPCRPCQRISLRPGRSTLWEY